MGMNATPERVGSSVDAVSIVADFVRRKLNGQSLTAAQLRSLPRRDLVAGWRFRMMVDDGLRDIDVVLEVGFPWEPPRAYLRNPPALGVLPHLEPDGCICALPARSPADPSDPVGIMRSHLRAILGLAERWADRDWVEDELKREFLSYLDLKTAAVPIRSLLPPGSPTTKIVIWRGRNFTLVGADEESVTRWLRNLGASMRDKPRFARGAFIKLTSLPLPDKMPRTAHDLKVLAGACGAEQLFADVVLSAKDSAVIALGLPTRPRLVAIAYDVRPPPDVKMGRRSPPRRPIQKGFRPGRVPREVELARRAGAAIKVAPVRIQRLDASWVHGRDENPDVHRLQRSRVAVLGCGSLGSGVAVQLAQAGVGHLDLVDPEHLQSANVGRHVLGMDDLGRGKATALAELIGRRFPHLPHVVGRGARWQHLVDEAHDVLTGADLLISTIGSWRDEGALERWRCGRPQPGAALYGWLEPHAVAGHAVLLGPEGPCFGCGLDRFGQSRLRVADWQGRRTTRTEAACSAEFQPYGPTHLSFVQGLITEISLDALLGRPAAGHHIWSAPRQASEEQGGRWTAEWETSAGSCVDQGARVRRPWDQNPSCVICQNRS